MTMKHSTMPKQGSALLMTLLCTALLLVLVVAFSVFVRLELRQVVQHQELQQAKAHARLGAQMAMGRLQELAGVDTRVTLPAEANADVTPHHNNRYWVGVRDAAAFRQDSAGPVWNPDYARHIGWLISQGGSADPAVEQVGASGEALPGYGLLVGEGSVSAPGDRIAAPLVDVRNDDGTPAGRFAWWAGEENTKAQINLSDPFAFDGDADTDAWRAYTVQRTALETWFPGFDPADETHARQVGRVEILDQLAMTGFQSPEDPVVPRDFFHEFTLGAYGLPVNPSRGGLKRDLTPVFQEAWDNNGRVPSGPGTQFAALVQDREAHIQRMRQQTLALPASRPADVPLHAWNALRTVTLRDDQADTSFLSSSSGHPIPELLFPPFSDMALTSDTVPSWRQLISFATINAPGRGALGPQGYRPGRQTQDDIHPMPVIARMNMGVYFTFDGGTIRSHFVPSVVIWNPWSKPMALDGQFVRFQYSDFWMEGFKLYFEVSHPDWDGGRRRWTGGYTLNWAAPPGGHRHDRLFVFELEPSRIPAGAAMVYTMDEHVKFSMDSTSDSHPWISAPSWNAGNRDLTGYLDEFPQVTLKPGIHDGGGYSMYLEEDFHSKVIRYATIVPTVGSYTGWISPRFPIYRPAPQPSDVPEAQRHIAINEGGLDGWNFHETRISWSRSDNGSSLMSIELSLANSPNVNHRTTNLTSQPLISIYRLHRGMPSGFHSRGPGQGGWDQLPRFAEGLPPSFPGEDQPFVFDPAVHPSFPTWGLSWGLRLPDSSFTPNPAANASQGLFAPLQWLAHSNPTAAYHTPLPNSESRAGGNQTQFMGPASYVGGFTLDGPSYFDLSQYTDDDEERYTFVGHTDALPPLGHAPGGMVRAVLREAPGSVDELVSIASLQHAGIMGMDTVRRDGNDNNWRGSALTAHPNFWNNGGNMQPTYPIGNAMLMPFADPARGYTNLFATEASPPSPPSPPWEMGYGDRFSGWRASPWYDLSWAANYFLWDDYMFTSPANSRLVWTNGVEERDLLGSASTVRVQGAFNVNSTSVEAWTGLLAGLLDVEIPNERSDPERSGDERIPFARFLHPLSRSYSPEQGDTYEHAENYTGNRRLTLEEVEALAEAIVDQVKERGPFLSLSDFVNRRLLAEGDDPDGHRRMGALQAAIEAAGLNGSQVSAGDPHSRVDAGDAALNSTSFASYDAEVAAGPRNRAAPGYLMQSDLLARIGSVLQVRSDTFRIRAYGETGSGARAWCELWVRREADYVDPADDPAAMPGTLTRPVNERFGRRFEVFRFRWLNEEDV